MPDSNPTILAIIGTVMGGSGLKIVEYYLSKSKTKVDEASTIRTELRTEVDNLRKLIKDTEAEVDEWRNKYYALLDEVAQLRAEAEAAKAVAKLKALEAETLAAQKIVYEAQNPPKPVPKKRAPRKTAPKKEVENEGEQ